MSTPPVEVQMNKGVQAFGMSITAGSLAANEVNYWVNRVAAFIGGPVDNKAIGGTGFPSMVQQIHTYTGYGSTPRSKLVVIDGPLNDVRQVGPAALRTTVPSLDAMLSTAFAGYMRSASQTSSQVVRTGSWLSLGSTYGGRSCAPCFGGLSPMCSSDPNASITFSFVGPIVALHGFLSETDDWKDMKICIDDVEWGSTEWAGKARSGTGKQAAALVIGGLGDGAHTLKVSHKDGETGTIVVDCIQAPYRPGIAPVMLGTIPNIPNWPQYGAIGTWDDAVEVNEAIISVAERWHGYGFPVADVEITSEAYDYSPDGIHRTDRGHLNWAMNYLGRMRVTPLAY